MFISKIPDTDFVVAHVIQRNRHRWINWHFPRGSQAYWYPVHTPVHTADHITRWWPCARDQSAPVDNNGIAPVEIFPLMKFNAPVDTEPPLSVTPLALFILMMKILVLLRVWCCWGFVHYCHWMSLPGWYLLLVNTHRYNLRAFLHLWMPERSPLSWQLLQSKQENH